MWLGNLVWVSFCSYRTISNMGEEVESEEEFEEEFQEPGDK